MDECTFLYIFCSYTILLEDGEYDYDEDDDNCFYNYIAIHIYVCVYMVWGLTGCLGVMR
jgi:hypothetical protein